MRRDNEELKFTGGKNEKKEKHRYKRKQGNG